RTRLGGCGPRVGARLGGASALAAGFRDPHLRGPRAGAVAYPGPRCPRADDPGGPDAAAVPAPRRLYRPGGGEASGSAGRGARRRSGPWTVFDAALDLGELPWAVLGASSAGF